MTNSKVMLTRPYEDVATIYLFNWSGFIKKAAEIKHGKERVIDVKDKKAKRRNVESYIKKRRPEVIIFNGHGSESQIKGHGEIIIDLDNVNLLKKKVIYCRSCKSASVLGKIAVEHEGAVCFLGYKEDFAFYHNKNKVSNPTNDEISRPILESSNRAALSLVKGEEPEEAQNKSMKTYDYWIDKYLNSTELEAPRLLICLLWNKENQVLIENK